MAEEIEPRRVKGTGVKLAYETLRDEILSLDLQPGAVLDGRDIGTVICPEAELKLYVTASDEVRALRRASELGADPAETLAALRERDARDSARATAPLRAAEDAVTLDTTEMSVTEAVTRSVKLVIARRGAGIC